MNALKTIPAICLFISLAIIGKGQGCSDAGFCTINSLKPHETDTIAERTNQIKTGISYGKADHSVYIIANYLEYNKLFTDKLGMDLKVTSIYQNGNDISSFGLSDIFLNASYAMSNYSTVTFGMKIPLSRADKMNQGLPLPMDYQNSLGTLDLILGLGFEIKKLQLVLAWQQPLVQNKNEFLADDYPVNSELSNFQSTNAFKRQGDIMLRVSYPFQIASKFRITPGVLPIYHLANDKYTDNGGLDREIKGSKGLTLNTNLYFDFDINHTNTIQLFLGMPLVVREIRPDGLTRSFLITFEYQIRF